MKLHNVVEHFSYQNALIAQETKNKFVRQIFCEAELLIKNKRFAVIRKLKLRAFATVGNSSVTVLT